jgi:hypothetical protein
MSKRKPNWADRERVILLAEYEKRKVILKGKQSNKSVHYLSIETLKRNYQG